MRAIAAVLMIMMTPRTCGAKTSLRYLVITTMMMMLMIMMRMMITTMMYLPEDRKRSTSLHSYLWYVDNASSLHFMQQNIT